MFDEPGISPSFSPSTQVRVEFAYVNTAIGCWHDFVCAFEATLGAGQMHVFPITDQDLPLAKGGTQRLMARVIVLNRGPAVYVGHLGEDDPTSKYSETFGLGYRVNYETGPFPVKMIAGLGLVVRAR